VQISGTSKDPSLCGIPECNKKKRRNSKDGGFYDFCGRSHALEADKRGITVVHGDYFIDSVISECLRMIFVLSR